MKRYGPLLTLLAGAAVAVVLLAVNTQVSRVPTGQGAAPAGAVPATATPPTAAPTTTAPAPPTRAAAAVGQSTYAGRVDGGAATIAIAIHKGQAIAYLCDGRRLEAWLRGTAADGKLTLANDRGASLTGTYSAASAGGTVTVANRRFTFTVSVVTAPSGLYRATANVRNGLARMGWIALPDLSVVGVMTLGEQEPQGAPTFNPLTGTANLDGEQIQAQSVDGVTGSGF